MGNRISVFTKFMSHTTHGYIEGYRLIHSQKHALAKNTCNFSSLVGIVGSLRASRVDADELKYSNHLIFEAGDVFAIAITCNFSKLSSGVIELRV